MLQLSASLAGGIPVDLRDTVTGLDDHNIARLVTAIQHASGNRPAGYVSEPEIGPALRSRSRSNSANRSK